MLPFNGSENRTSDTSKNKHPKRALHPSPTFFMDGTWCWSTLSLYKAWPVGPLSLDVLSKHAISELFADVLTKAASELCVIQCSNLGNGPSLSIRRDSDQTKCVCFGGFWGLTPDYRLWCFKDFTSKLRACGMACLSCQLFYILIWIVGPKLSRQAVSHVFESSNIPWKIIGDSPQKQIRKLDENNQKPNMFHGLNHQNPMCPKSYTIWQFDSVLLKMAIYSEVSHSTWWFSMIFHSYAKVYQRVSPVKSH